MVLSLLAPLLATSHQRGGVIDTRRWDYYLTKLRDRKYSQLKRNSSYNYATINEAIGISLADLDQETRHLLHDFVIFLDDVNIPAAVLQVLWQCSPYEVEEKIAILVSKSLIAKHVVHHQFQLEQEQEHPVVSVLYGIHDLVLDYLKTHVTYEEQRLCHRKLIDAYLSLYCSRLDGDDNYGALPNDNYIFWFIGYHLYKAEYCELFPTIFLHLNFISAKLRATGPSDLLNDLRKYQDYIIMPLQVVIFFLHFFPFLIQFV